MKEMVYTERDGGKRVACPACYLLHLAEDSGNWRDEFVIYAAFKHYPVRRGSDQYEDRLERIGDVCDDAGVLLPLTFHAGHLGCSDEDLLSMGENIRVSRFARFEVGVYPE